MYKPKGIPNIGNSCYLSALIQCLRTCLSPFHHEASILETYINGDESKGISSLWNSVNGEMQDCHDFYMELIERMPSVISRHFLLEYSGGTKMSYLPITTSLENGGDHITHVSDVVCIYRIPSPMSIADFSSLEIDTSSTGILTTHKYKMKCCICYQHGSHGRESLRWHGYSPDRKGIDHYYALVKRDNQWYKCNDSLVTPIYSEIEQHSIYMVFYMK